jgi:hypothetical protein
MKNFDIKEEIAIINADQNKTIIKIISEKNSLLGTPTMIIEYRETFFNIYDYSTSIGISLEESFEYAKTIKDALEIIDKNCFRKKKN